jgi:hypothetical protein
LTDRTGESKRVFWDLTICGEGLVCMALVLFVNLDSPRFELLLVVWVAYELLETYRHNREELA